MLWWLEWLPISITVPSFTSLLSIASDWICLWQWFPMFNNGMRAVALQRASSEICKEITSGRDHGTNRTSNSPHNPTCWARNSTSCWTSNSTSCWASNTSPSTFDTSCYNPSYDSTNYTNYSTSHTYPITYCPTPSSDKWPRSRLELLMLQVRTARPRLRYEGMLQQDPAGFKSQHKDHRQ